MDNSQLRTSEQLHAMLPLLSFHRTDLVPQVHVVDKPVHWTRLFPTIEDHLESGSVLFYDSEAELTTTGKAAVISFVIPHHHQLINKPCVDIILVKMSTWTNEGHLLPLPASFKSLFTRTDIRRASFEPDKTGHRLIRAGLLQVGSAAAGSKLLEEFIDVSPFTELANNNPAEILTPFGQAAAVFGFMPPPSHRQQTHVLHQLGPWQQEAPLPAQLIIEGVRTALINAAYFVWIAENLVVGGKIVGDSPAAALRQLLGSRSLPYTPAAPHLLEKLVQSENFCLSNLAVTRALNKAARTLDDPPTPPFWHPTDIADSNIAPAAITIRRGLFNYDHIYPHLMGGAHASAVDPSPNNAFEAHALAAPPPNSDYGTLIDCLLFNINWKGARCYKCLNSLGPVAHRPSHCPLRTNKHLTCAYPACNRPEEHVTIACPKLHCRCTRCHFRGHFAIECENKAFDRWHSIFTSFAHFGYHTSSYLEDSKWGFFPPFLNQENLSLDDIFQRPSAAHPTATGFSRVISHWAPDVVPRTSTPNDQSPQAGAPRVKRRALSTPSPSTSATTESGSSPKPSFSPCKQ